MPIEKRIGLDAYKMAAQNSVAKYPTPEKNAGRLYPLAQPEPRASFQFSPEAKIFTIGSCFARNIERALTDAGFDVLSKNPTLSDAVVRRGSDEGLFNKYTIHSILNELKWALDPATPYPEKEALVQYSSDQWIDMQLGSSRVLAPLKEMLEFRHTYTETMKRIRQADVVIITLGIAEAWYDLELGLYMNSAPSLSLCRRYPDRFEMHALDYNDILAALVEIDDLLSQHCLKKPRLLLTVSPVPLFSTFRDQDVLTANAYSKSVQRAAVEAFVQLRDADYFPSYEFVTLSDPKSAWIEKDFRHVSVATVDRIMSTVLDHYVHGARVNILENLRQAKILFYAGDFSGAEALLAPVITSPRVSENTLYTYGIAKKRQGKWQEAFDIFNALVTQKPDMFGALENAIQAARRIGLKEELERLAELHMDRFPERGNFLQKNKLTLVGDSRKSVAGKVV